MNRLQASSRIDKNLKDPHSLWSSFLKFHAFQIHCLLIADSWKMLRDKCGAAEKGRIREGD